MTQSKPTAAAMRAAKEIKDAEPYLMFTSDEDIAQIIDREFAELVEAAGQMLGYIEMTLAHTGSQSVAQIESELKRTKTISEVSTSHHLGCPITTRKVNLDAARNALAKLSAN